MNDRSSNILNPTRPDPSAGEVLKKTPEYIWNALKTVLLFLFRPGFMVFLFKATSVIALLVFLYAYYHTLQSYRMVHRQFIIGFQQSRECGFEYMEKESGVQQLYALS